MSATKDVQRLARQEGLPALTGKCPLRIVLVAPASRFLGEETLGNVAQWLERALHKR